MIDLKVRNKIAQLIVDMNVGEKKPVRKQETVSYTHSEPTRPY